MANGRQSSRRQLLLASSPPLLLPLPLLLLLSVHEATRQAAASSSELRSHAASNDFAAQTDGKAAATRSGEGGGGSPSLELFGYALRTDLPSPARAPGQRGHAVPRKFMQKVSGQAHAAANDGGAGGGVGRTSSAEDQPLFNEAGGGRGKEERKKGRLDDEGDDDVMQRRFSALSLPSKNATPSLSDLWEERMRLKEAFCQSKRGQFAVAAAAAAESAATEAAAARGRLGGTKSSNPVREDDVIRDTDVIRREDAGGSSSRSSRDDAEAMNVMTMNRIARNREMVDVRNIQGKKEKVPEEDGEQSKRGGDGKASAAGGEGEGETTERRRESVRRGMQHAWSSYEKYAWGCDELKPVSKECSNDLCSVGATIVDSLDTLHIMGLMDEFNHAKEWVAANLTFKYSETCSVFETTIRILGGLLSAYDLSGEDIFLAKARQLADRLLPAYSTKAGIPKSQINLVTGASQINGWSGGSSVLADVGTTQLEMVALSQRTNVSRYAKVSENVIDVIERAFPKDGLVPILMDPDTGKFSSQQVTFGGMGDSFYEYLLKVWLQGGKTDVVARYRRMWDVSMRGMMAKLVQRMPSGLTYVAEELVEDYLVHEMDHLACFMPGMLVLGMDGADNATANAYLNLAKEITRTCYEFYRSQPSGLSGESYKFNKTTNEMKAVRYFNIGRPETVEALFYMWRKTKDPMYREWGWNIWQAFEKHCKVPSGYTGLTSVMSATPQKDDKMQSFFLAETLKYLYLLFSPGDVVPLDQWVFNTEAHPLRIVPRSHAF